METEDINEEVLQELTEWRRKGAALREKLSKEREGLRRRLQQVEQALAEIPDAQLRLPEPAAPISAELTSPGIVCAVLARHPHGADASQIISEVKAIKPSIDPVLIHSAISRLVKHSKILAVGKRGGKIYRLARVADTISVSDHVQITVTKVPPQNPRKGRIGPESQLGRSIAVLSRTGQPLHVNQIIEIIQSQTRKHVDKASLIGALARAAKAGNVVCRETAPNTFGLIEWRKASQLRQPPDAFGRTSDAVAEGDQRMLRRVVAT